MWKAPPLVPKIVSMTMNLSTRIRTIGNFESQFCQIFIYPPEPPRAKTPIEIKGQKAPSFCWKIDPITFPRFTQPEWAFNPQFASRPLHPKERHFGNNLDSQKRVPNFHFNIKILPHPQGSQDVPKPFHISPPATSKRKNRFSNHKNSSATIEETRNEQNQGNVGTCLGKTLSL